METECEIAVDLRSDRVVYELPREASILRRGPRSAQRRLRSKSRRFLATVRTGSQELFERVRLRSGSKQAARKQGLFLKLPLVVAS